MAQKTAVARERLEVPLLSPLERKLVITPEDPQRQRPTITAVPESSVLDRARGFLPQIAAANLKLEHEMQVRPATDFDIEVVAAADEAAYVEMDLACGLFELRNEASVQAAEQAIKSGATHIPLAADDATCSVSDGSNGSDSEGDEGAVATVMAARGVSQGGTNNTDVAVQPATKVTKTAIAGVTAKGEGVQGRKCFGAIKSNMKITELD